MNADSLGGYSAVAAALTAHYDLGKPLDRRQVEMWSKRRTLNAAGEPFPQPRHVNTAAKPREPRVLFDIAEVIEWARAGVPVGPRGSEGYTLPGQPGSRVHAVLRRGLYSPDKGRKAAQSRWHGDRVPPGAYDGVADAQEQPGGLVITTLVFTGPDGAEHQTSYTTGAAAE